MTDGTSTATEYKVIKPGIPSCDDKSINGKDAAEKATDMKSNGAKTSDEKTTGETASEKKKKSTDDNSSEDN